MIVGIDPGLDGAIVFLPEVPDGRDAPTGVIIRDMPTVKIRKSKRAYDFAAIGVLLEKPGLIDMVVIEQTQPMPRGKNAQASHGLGLCEGFFRGICVGHMLPHILYRPKMWQKFFGITKTKGDLKAQSYTIASGLFPKASLTGPRGGKKDGRCDALLIAEYGRLRFRA
jgi:hypothetical protein